MPSITPHPFSWPEFEALLRAVNVPNDDDGKTWKRTDRLDAIAARLASASAAPTDYTLFHRGALSHIYARRGFDPRAPFLLLSTHVDSLYGERHHFGPAPGAPEADLLGTFDNSITNAVTLDLMRRGGLPVQTLIAFTGDEEKGSGGALEVIKFLGRKKMRSRAELILVLDITGENAEGHPCTLENVFVRRTRPDPRVSYFRGRKALAEHLVMCLGAEVPVYLAAAGDESWDYHDYGMTCITFCFPSRPHPENQGTPDGVWMHDSRGLLIRRADVPGYSAALARLCEQAIQ